MNGYALLFSASVSVLTGILFGLLPALNARGRTLVETLKDAAKGSGSAAAGGRTRNLLVIAEIALSVILSGGRQLDRPRLRESTAHPPRLSV